MVRNTLEGRYAAIWPAHRGLTKRHGCVEFEPENRCGSSFSYPKLQKCREKYNDYPKSSTAYLVYPCKNGVDFWWEPVHDLIDFS